MNRMQEIEKRMSEIGTELGSETANLDALETELNALTEEKRTLVKKAEQRSKLIGSIASGATGTSIGNMLPEEKTSEVRFAANSPEYREAYFKNLMGKPLTTEERTAITASAVIPTSTLNQIVEKLAKVSALYERITKSNFPGNISIPVENAKADAAFVAMATAATDATDSFATISLAAYKLIKTFEINADVMAMSIDSFESFIVTALIKKMNKAIENAILNGTGSNQPTGLLKTGEITAAITFTKAAMKYADIMKIIGTLPTAYHPMAAFTMPRVLFFEEVLGMQTTDGNKIVVADAQSPAKFNILGYPVIINDLVPTDTIVFGDFSYYHMNWSSDIAIDTDTSVGFRTGSTVYRGMALVDGKKTLDEAFVVSTRALT